MPSAAPGAQAAAAASPVQTQPPPEAPPPRVSPLLRHRRVITAAVVVVVAAVAVTGWREHWPPSWLFGTAAAPPPALAWTPGQGPLPADALKGNNQFAELNDVACAEVGGCVAVGSYTPTASTNDNTDGLIETLSGGTWHPVKAPIDIPGASHADFVSLGGVACPAAGTCVAVGSYLSQTVVKPLIETLSGEGWVPATAPLPGDAGKGKPGLLSLIACPAPGTCVATGWYTDGKGDTQGLIDTLSGRTWTALKAPLPAGASPHATPGLPKDLVTALVAVRCPAVGSCVATGNYIDSRGDTQGWIDTLSGGSWTAQRAPLPGDAAANPYAFLWTIACQAPGSCVAAGHYNTRSGQSRDLVVTLSGGTWTPAATPLPPDAAAAQKWSLQNVTGLTGVACQAPGTCAAQGNYLARNGAFPGVIASLSGGKWTAARAPLPAGAILGAKEYAFFTSAACPSSGSCLAVGGFESGAGSLQPLIETGAPARR